MDHQISARRPDLILADRKKRIWKLVDLAVLTDHRVKVKLDKYLNLAREQKKSLDHEGYSETNYK